MREGFYMGGDKGPDALWLLGLDVFPQEWYPEQGWVLFPIVSGTEHGVGSDQELSGTLGVCRSVQKVLGSLQDSWEGG